MFCEKCGKEIMDEAKYCASCGCAVPTEDNATVKAQDDVSEPLKDNTVESVASQEENDDVAEEILPNFTSHGTTTEVTKKKFVFSKKLIIIIAAVVAVLIAVGIIVGNSISLNKYKDKLESTYSSMKIGAQVAEEYAALQSKVWYNSISELSSTETDKYTMDEYGWYYSDFNDALSAFYEGESSNYDVVSINVSTVELRMLELKDCPSKFEEEYKALKDLYVAYSELTDLVVGDSSYSYNSFSEALDEAKSNYKSALSSARLILE